MLKKQKRIESLVFQLEETHHELEPSEQELRQECELTEDAMFDRENRLALLKSGNFEMHTKSIFALLFKAMKERERAKK